MGMPHTTLATIISLLTAGPVAVQQADIAAPSPLCRASGARLRARMQLTHDNQHNVGMSVAIMHRGDLVFTGNLGFADLEHEVPVTDETRFGIASVTKAFTGVALLKAVAAGRIELDAPIQRYVPEFPTKEGGVITPRLLMVHLAGIRHWADERTPELYATHMTDVMQILPLFKDDPLVGPPGHQYHYSSYGYDLLGMAIQQATGTPFQSYVRREIFAPLGLTTTDFDDVEAVIPNRARRYSYYHPVTYAENDGKLYRVPEWDYSHNMAAGNIISSATDLARFGDALLRPGLLTGAAFDLLYTANATDYTRSPWSVGFFYRPAGHGARQIHITGANAGIQSALYIYPDDELVVVVLSNAWGIGARSGEMVVDLPEGLAALCLRGREA